MHPRVALAIALCLTLPLSCARKRSFTPRPEPTATTPREKALLGASLLDGEQRPRDFKRAKALLDEACKAGDQRGCAELALMFVRGDGVKEDPARAEPMLRAACDAGEPRGCTGLGLASLKLPSTPPALQQTADLLAQVCTAGTAAACEKLSQLSALLPDVTPRQPVLSASERAVSLWRSGCAAGDGPSCTELGVLASRRRLRDESAAALFEKGCKAGDALGCVNASVEALRGTEKAAAAGALRDLDKRCPEQPLACRAVARAALREGDARRAYEAAGKACLGGDVESCLLVAGDASVAKGKQEGCKPFCDRPLPTSVIEAHRAGCDAGDATSCSALHSMRRDEPGALALLERGCALGDPSVCRELREAASVSTARAAMQKGCALGEPEACLWLATRAESGPEGPERARALLDRSCAFGGVTACMRLAPSDDDKRFAPIVERVTALLLKACEGGSPVACGAAGKRVFEGRGVAKSEPSGVALMARACYGRAELCAGLRMKQVGKQGTDELARACERGEVAACTEHAISLREGFSIEKNHDAAYALLAETCAAGHGQGCYEQARMLFAGVGTRLDMQAAIERYGKACDMGVIASCGELETIYRKGRGVPENPAEAERFKKRVCELGGGGVCLE